MYPLSDKDLDRLSREAAEQFAVEPHASDWDQLASKLDKEIPVQKDDKKRRALWLLLVLLLTCGGGLFWLLTGNGTGTNAVATATPSQETVTKNSSSKESNNSNDNTTIATDKENNKNSTTGTNSTTATPKEPAATNTADNTVAPTASVESNSVAASSEKTKKAISQKEISSGNQKQASTAKNKSSYVPGIFVTSNSRKATKKGIADKPEAIVKNKEANNIAPLVVDTESYPKDKSIIVTVPVSTGTDDKATVSPTTDSTTEKLATPKTSADTVTTNSIASVTKKTAAKKGTPSQRGLSIGVTAGFDYSRINNTANNKPGYNFGLQVSYELTKRWSFNTGFILTKKNYSAAGADFHPPKHYWTTYIALNDVVGNCEMWDIPLNIRYNLTTSKTKWFINTGFSTYIMRKQFYNYYYTVNNTPREKDWSMNSQTNYWFNVLNVSAGIEKQLNRSWSIQAEPFIKAPLKGVGFGNMSINSYGVLATLKFHPVFKH
jgi:Outer membrane protein beta-barrel domain